MTYGRIETAADLPPEGPLNARAREKSDLDFKVFADPARTWEHAKDLAAFSNALGGVLLIGAEDKTGQLVYPGIARQTRAGKLGDRIGEEKHATNHAKALRLDLRRCFLVLHREARRNKTGRYDVRAPRPGTRRWRELFTETERTRPVDFHSFRRLWVEGTTRRLDAEAVEGRRLTAHSSEALTNTYTGHLRDRAEVIPEHWLPRPDLPIPADLPALIEAFRKEVLPGGGKTQNRLKRRVA